MEGRGRGNGGKGKRERRKGSDRMEGGREGIEGTG
jgi:hypothetical protein